MPCVKRSFRSFIIPAALLAGGCSDLQLARFAPPGIVKYEDIASEKPQSPEIQERISGYQDANDPEYPRLAETPSEKDRPKKRPQKRVEAQIAELESARDALESDVETARLEAEAAIQEGQLLTEQRDALSARVDQDEAAAKAELETRRAQQDEK